MTIANAVGGIETGDHVVQFYEREQDLVVAVGSYLAAAAQAGEVAIVIATPAHRAAFDAELAVGGVDAAAARAAGRYLEFDAAETLALFSGSGSVDREAYFAVVGTVVREAVATGRRVRAYGEMVALLWDAGDVLAAIELEALWNELGRQVPFSLYCAYPHASVSAAGQAHALENVCHLHSSVVGSTDPRTPRQARRAATNLSAEPAAPGAARRFVVATLRDWGYSTALAQDAAAVVTELATNAVVHVGSAFEVTLRAEEALVRIGVRDSGPSGAVVGLHPRVGHGLALVAAIAGNWGVDPDGDGKVVWAEMDVLHASFAHRGRVS
jgi:hypothetical protein